MRLWILLAGCIAAWFAPVVSAQTWVAYVPWERDFRVLMPIVPMRVLTKEGSVEFRADSGRLQYFVYRHDPRRLADVHNVRDDIVKRITRGDETIRGIGENESDLADNEFIFKAGGVYSMHRAFIEGGKYYELVVKSADQDSGVDRHLARDYFSSFQIARGTVFTGVTAIPTLDSCNSRPNPVARMLCQYVVCMQPGYESQPVCSGLPRLLRSN